MQPLTTHSTCYVHEFNHSVYPLIRSCISDIEARKILVTDWTIASYRAYLSRHPPTRYTLKIQTLISTLVVEIEECSVPSSTSHELYDLL